MKPDHEMKDGRIRLFRADCLGVLKTMDAESVSSIVVDPPYGLKFMGKKWDCEVPSVEVWAECLRVLKPGGYLLCFAGTRTQHRMAVNIEDAGFEIRDMIAWVYGSGFPKSLDVSKSIDKAAGAEREVVGTRPIAYPDSDCCGTPNSNSTGDAPNQRHDFGMKGINMGGTKPVTAPATEAAKQWEGWGTALKPAMEPITVARKPFKGTVAENVLRYSTGALNIDGCRVGTNAGWSYPNGRGGSGWHNRESLSNNLTEPMAATQGRWPANLIHDGSDEGVGLFPNVGKAGKHGGGEGGFNSHGGHNCYGKGDESFDASGGYADSGSAARFFYCAKASKADRDEGCEGLDARVIKITEGHGRGDINTSKGDGTGIRENRPRRNHHPTVKPTALMRYLCRLVTPPGGIVLDPFMGSGSTGRGAIIEGFNFVGVELDPDYFDIAVKRIEASLAKEQEAPVVQKTLFE